MSALAVSLGRRRVLRKDTVQECGGDGSGSMSDPLRSRVGAELKSRQKASAAQRPESAGQAERWAPSQFHPNAPGVLTTEPCLKGCLVCVLLFVSIRISSSTKKTKNVSVNLKISHNLKVESYV